MISKVYQFLFFPFLHKTDEREVRYSVISGFVFLRFFAPAILHPKLFDLTSEQIVSVKPPKFIIIILKIPLSPKW